ncbi:MAG: DUF2207 domain-containing protein [Propionibacteriaceae bacterium]|nr:DUF2207 domain-containing protein [Propionibacteriaceae bacterium]
MRFKRALVGFALAVVIVALAWRPANAWAVDDYVDSWQVSYTVDTSGVLHVKETLVWRFGTNSGRHGIDRALVIREPWDSSQDAVYEISNITVTSPDASSQFTTSTLGSGRNQQLDIRIGSSYQTVIAPTATYSLSYDVTGAMRSDTGFDELYWDAIPDNTPLVSNITITAAVPNGVLDVACFNGPPSTSNSCDSSSVGADGTATYTVASKAPGSIVTIGAKVGSGLVSDNQPHLVARGDQASVNALRGAGALSGVAAVGTIGVVGVLGTRNRRDQRFLGVAPGTVETSGQGVGPDNHPTIPVAFTPPKIPVAAAGLIDDGAVDVRDMTGTLLSLAVQGVIQLRQDAAVQRSWIFSGSTDQAIYAKLVKTDVELASHEAALLRDIFPGLSIGTEKCLTGQSTLAKAYQNMQTNVRADVEQAGWYKRMPERGVSAASAGAGASFGGLIRVAFLVVWAIVALGGTGLAGLINGLQSGSVGWLMWVAPLAIILIGLLVYRGLTRRGQRSAVGRAYADQVTGFREYLTTAEADQIKFEEGQDIFSQYLPWAVIYDVADRWTKLCGQLVAEGRLANIQPTWYYGDYRLFNMYVFTNSLGNVSRASVPAAPAGGWASGGTGFGGGSAFGGGGFSGGGGGGGGARSW